MVMEIPFDKTTLMTEAGEEVNATVMVTLDDDIDGDMDELNDAYEVVQNLSFECERMIVAQVALEQLSGLIGTFARPSYESRLVAKQTIRGIVNDVKALGLEGHFEYPIEDSQVTLEGVSEFFMYLWNGIVAIMKKIWDGITYFFKRTLGTTARLRRAAKAIQAKAESKSGLAPAKTANYRKQIRKLTIGGKDPKRASDISAALTKAHDALSTINGEYHNLIISTGNKMVEALNRFSAYAPEESLTRINEAAEAFTKVAVLNVFKVSRIGSTDNYKGPELPGNRYVMVHAPRLSSAEVSSAVSISHINRSTRFTLEKLAGDDDKYGQSLADMDASHVSTLAGNVLAVCDLIDNIVYKNEKPFIEIKDKMSKATLRAEQDCQRRGDPNQAMTECMASAMRYNAAYSQWATQFQASIVRNGMESCRAVLEACDRYLKSVG